MFSGLRLRILFLLGAFLLFAFAPVYFAISTFSNISLQGEQKGSLARLLQLEVDTLSDLTKEGTFALSPEKSARLKALLDADELNAISIAHRTEGWILRLGRPASLAPLSLGMAHSLEGSLDQVDHAGRSFLIYSRKVKDHELYALAELEVAPRQRTSLVSLLALTMAVGGAALLFIAYLALTHWIVRPIMNLAGAAQRVERGGIMSHGLKNAPSELLNLSASLVTMTQQLRAEEASLRNKIDELESKKLELATAQDSLIRSERLASVGHLAAGLAHEVGNPLSAVVCILDLLLAGDLNHEEEQDFLLRMKRETERIHQVMNDLLTFARGDNSTASIPMNNLVQSAAHSDANHVIEEVLKLLQPQQQFKDVLLETKLQENLPLAPIRSEELEQVILNLLLNAGDACEGSGKILISTYQNENKVGIEVQDSGPGVSNSFKETLFEPFVTSKEVGQGTGLGLSVSQGLISSNGGVLELLRSSPQGATFRILFSASAKL